MEKQWRLIIEQLKVDGLTVIVADYRFYYLNDIIFKVFFMEMESLLFTTVNETSKRELMIQETLIYFGLIIE